MKENLEKVLKDLGGSVNRKAQFHCSISLVFRGNFYFFEGIIEGEILHEPRGLEGFGYDPIFRPLGYHQTFAELGIEEKNGISHRALALEKMKLTIEKLSRE
jgi:XTP/dITP diphosphohydrolase